MKRRTVIRATVTGKGLATVLFFALICGAPRWLIVPSCLILIASIVLDWATR